MPPPSSTPFIERLAVNYSGEWTIMDPCFRALPNYLQNNGTNIVALNFPVLWLIFAAHMPNNFILNGDTSYHCLVFLCVSCLGMFGSPFILKLFDKVDIPCEAMPAYFNWSILALRIAALPYGFGVLYIHQFQLHCAAVASCQRLGVHHPFLCKKTQGFLLILLVYLDEEAWCNMSQPTFA